MVSMVYTVPTVFDTNLGQGRLRGRMGEIRDKRVLYESTGRKDKVIFRLLALVVFLMATFMVVDAISRFRQRPSTLFLLRCLPICFMFYLAWTIAIARGLSIYEWGIVVPTNPLCITSGRVLRFSEISEIRLNTGPKGFKTNLEVATTRGKTLSIPKGSLTNWDEFYRILTEDLKGKVRVVD